MSLLDPKDVSELQELHELYERALDSIPMSVDENPISAADLSKLYVDFIQRRANFFGSLPVYHTLAARDRASRIRLAISMSTYITSAYLVDLPAYAWPRPTCKYKTPFMSAGLVRKYLSHEQFGLVMRFHHAYAPLYRDESVVVLMHVLSLLYPEPTLGSGAWPRLERARRHYGALLQRYLARRDGPERGAAAFQQLLRSQMDMRELTDVNQNVEFKEKDHKVQPGFDLENSLKVLCNDTSRGIVDNLLERVGNVNDPNAIFTRSMKQPYISAIYDLMTRLSQCEDPNLLEVAKNSVTRDLCQKFHDLLK